MEKLIFDEIEGLCYDCVDIIVEFIDGECVLVYCYIVNIVDDLFLLFDWYF